jgi:hypothetical protein
MNAGRAFENRLRLVKVSAICAVLAVMPVTTYGETTAATLGYLELRVSGPARVGGAPSPRKIET